MPIWSTFRPTTSISKLTRTGKVYDLKIFSLFPCFLHDAILLFASKILDFFSKPTYNQNLYHFICQLYTGKVIENNIMGASDSKHTDESQQLRSGHHSEDDTRTPPINKRLMKLTDPRSPTDGVDRTPIVTEKPTGGENHHHATPLRIDTSVTPEPEDAPHDPRSPSCNVARTPQPFAFNDPRSPSGNVSRTPFIPHLNDATGKTAWLCSHFTKHWH